MEIDPNKFKTRKELDRYVATHIGTDMEKNRESSHRVKAKREDLRRLRLDDLKSIHGVKIEITDTPTQFKEHPNTAPLRGNLRK